MQKMSAPRFAPKHPAVRPVHGPARSEVFFILSSGKAQQVLYFQEDIDVFLHNFLNFFKKSLTTLSVHDKITFDFERQSVSESFQSNLPWTAQRG